MEKLIAYHGQQSVKDKYMARYAMHRQLDEVRQGVGYENKDGKIQACFIGCTLDNYDHSRFPIELGWPEWLAQLADTIFEGLPKSEAPQFGTDLLGAVREGSDLEPIRNLFLIAVQQRNLARLEGNTEAYAEQCRSAIRGVIAWLESSGTESAASAAWSAWSAASAAWSAAESAESAAWSARSAARSAASAAASAAESAASAAAWSAASAASAAAWSAAESAASAEYRFERDLLLSLVASA